MLNALADRQRVGAWRLRRLIASKLFHPPAGPVTCSTNYGFKIVIDPSRDNEGGVERTIFETGTYEAGTLHVLQEILGDGDVFLDVGANVGLMSLLAATRVGASGQVHSFEPVPDINRLLRASVAVNAYANITIHKTGVGSSPSHTRIFSRTAVNRGSATLLGPGDSSPGFDIQVDTIDRFAAQQLGDKPIALIKIDVEGWELEVLKGAVRILSQQYSPALCIEFSILHPTHGGDTFDIFLRIRSLDYACFKLRGSKSTPSCLIPIDDIASLPLHDNLFCFRPHHLPKLGDLLPPRSG